MSQQQLTKVFLVLAICSGSLWAQGRQSGKWLVAGPFQGRNARNDLLQAQGGEEQVVPKAGEPAGELKWKEVTTPTKEHIDFQANNVFGGNENVVAYAATTLYSENGGPAMLQMKHDDGATVWLNHKKLGSWGIGERTVPVQLKKGENLVVAKVDQGGGGWDIMFKVLDPVQVESPVITPNGDGVNDAAQISLGVFAPTKVTVEVLDAQGKVVATPAKDKNFTPQQNSLSWEGKLTNGSLAPAGTYSIKATLPDGSVINGQVEIRQAEPLKRAEFSEIKNFFPLGVFYDYPLYPGPAGFEKECADLAAHNMNLVWLNNTNLDNRRAAETNLAAMAKHNVTCIYGLGGVGGFLNPAVSPTEFEARRRLAPLMAFAAKYPQIKGFYLADEPRAQEAYRLSVASRVMEVLNPVQPGLVCLIGKESMQRVQKEMDSPVMVIDPYPVSFGSEIGDFHMKGFGLPQWDMADYMDFARSCAGEGNRLWTILQTHNFQTQLREPTPAEVRAMSWIAMAHGSTGLIYFIYQTQQGWRGLVHEGKESERYAVAAEVCGVAQKIAPVLLTLKFSPDKAATTTQQLAEVQTFRQEKSGKVHLIPINRDVKQGRDVTIELKQPGKVRDLARAVQPEVKGAQVVIKALKPGEGTLLVIE